MTDISQFERRETYYSRVHNDHAELVALLRSDEPLNRITRDYLADVLEGKVKRKRGRKPKADIYGKTATAAALRNFVHGLVDAEKAELRANDYSGGDIHAQAIENVSSWYIDLTESQIDHVLRSKG